MKTVSIFISLLLLVAISGCNLEHKKGSTNLDLPENQTDNVAQEQVGDDRGENGVSDYEVLNTENMRGMYQDLQMDSAQIRKFEKRYKWAVDSLRAGKITISRQRVAQLKNEYLKKVLSKEQYSRYLQHKDEWD